MGVPMTGLAAGGPLRDGLMSSAARMRTKPSPSYATVATIVVSLLYFVLLERVVQKSSSTVEIHREKDKK